MVDENEIKKRFKLFKNVDPRVYEQLLRFCDQRVQERLEAVSMAPPDQILVCQGRAQEARAFFKLLTELPEDDPLVKPPHP